MKVIIGTTLLLALMAPQPAMAQSNQTNQAATLRKARLKVWTGITLVAAGAALLPITDVRRRASSEKVAMSFDGADRRWHRHSVLGVQAKAPGYAAFHCVRRDTRTEKQQCAGAAFLVDNETARREAGREESVGMGWM